MERGAEPEPVVATSTPFIYNFIEVPALLTTAPIKLHSLIGSIGMLSIYISAPILKKIGYFRKQPSIFPE